VCAECWLIAANETKDDPPANNDDEYPDPPVLTPKTQIEQHPLPLERNHRMSDNDIELAAFYSRWCSRSPRGSGCSPSDFGVKLLP
jgi:hypothetical protein